VSEHRQRCGGGDDCRGDTGFVGIECSSGGIQLGVQRSAQLFYLSQQLGDSSAVPFAVHGGSFAVRQRVPARDREAAIVIRATPATMTVNLR
jgi:hypothetical protein